MISFEDVWKSCQDSILGERKARVLYDTLCKVFDTTGDIAEIGVYRGGTSKLMRLMYPDRRLHCYDTFAGIKQSTPGVDIHKDGEFSCGLQQVQSVVGTTNVVYHIGMFPETFVPPEGGFSFVHSDTDTYFGTKATLKYVFPYLSKGGIILFDDYKWPNCPGVDRAVQEWLSSMSSSVRFEERMHQCLIEKI